MSVLPENGDKTFRNRILDQLDAVVLSCVEAQRPLEVDPARSELFELFAAVESAGGLKEDSELDLEAEGVCKALAERWGLKNATENWLNQNSQLPPEQMARMRRLWSLLRMWMEWTYAWERWPDFHAVRESGESASTKEIS